MRRPVNYLPRVGGSRAGMGSPLFLALMVFLMWKFAGQIGKFLNDPFGLSGGSGALNESGERTKTFDGISAPVTSKMTFSLDKAKVIAEALYTAMHPSGFFSAANDGTDEQAIFDQMFYIKSKDDLLAVVKAFGVRRYRDNLAGREDGDLFFWLREELSAAELDEIKGKLDLL